MSNPGELFLVFVPFLFIAVLANMGEGAPLFRWLAYAGLVLMNLLLILQGLVVMFLLPQVAEEPGLRFGSPATAFVLLATGLLAFLPLLPAVRSQVARWLNIDPANTVHTTALVFALYLLGLTAMQFFLDFGELDTAGIELTVLAVWEQALGFLLLGVVGAGLGLRRSLSETLARLGLSRVRGQQVLLGVGAIAALQLFDLAISLLWSSVHPDSFQDILDISRRLFRNFAGPAGAVTLGITAGVGEEILFRGALQPRFGLWLTTLLFTMGHAQYGLTPALFEVFVIGLVLGIVRTRANTTTAIFIHAGYNAVNVLLTPLILGQ